MLSRQLTRQKAGCTCGCDRLVQVKVLVSVVRVTIRGTHRGRQLAAAHTEV